MLTPFAPGRSAKEAHAALKAAAAAEVAARQCAVLWFGEMLARRLYRAFGYSSMPAYARVELGFSETRISDFMRLAQKLDALPAVKAALPAIGYTKAREIIEVATPRTQQTWVAAAQSSTRAELRARVKKAKAPRPAASLFEPAPEPAVEMPVRVSVEFTPEQHARWEALWEQVRKAGVAGDRAEVLLEALRTLTSTPSPATDNAENFRRRNLDQPVQIHIHQCPDCGKVEANGRQLGTADTERVQCDAVIHEPGKRATSSIPPRIRRAVLARDRHRCQAPGCGRRHFLEIHHKTPRAQGGTHDPANLITLCGSCHRLRHERGTLSGSAPGRAPAPPANRGGATGPDASPRSRGP